jgi:steroid 5-alpha reductase family enzyme
MLTLTLTSLGAVLALFFVLWLVSLKLRDASIVDMVWGAGFVLIAWIAYFTGGGAPSRRVLMTTMVTLWGLRLSGYLMRRNLGKGEDYRYQAMRRQHGERFPLVSLLQVFVLQAFVMWLVSMPVQAAQAAAQPITLGWLDILGLCVWAVGLFFEAVGDAQLARFKSNPQNDGKVMDRGLWRYTRHPNYFGDFMVWWGIYFVALSTLTAWWTIIGPALMSFFLMRVSGVPLLEKSLRAKRPDYEAYIKRTSAFFPRMPKRI